MNKTVFVTGGSKGIGAEVSKKLALSNYKICIGYNKSVIEAKKIKLELCNQGCDVEIFFIDLTDSSSIYSCIEKVLKWSNGSFYGLVNNAAKAQEKPFLEISDKDLSSMVDTNLNGPFICIREFLPEIIKNKGSIVNLSSIGGQWGGINQIHYASTKAGLIGLTKSIAKTFSQTGITCNAIAPGLIETDMIKNELDSDNGIKKLLNVPSGRLGRPDEVASVVKFLLSDDARYITGQTININGGMYFG